MKESLNFYIDGQWVPPVTPKTLDVLDPATEEPIGRISLGSAADVDKAVVAARGAHRPPRAHHRRVPSAPRRSRRDHLARDGGADVARERGAGAVGPRPSG